MEGRLSLFALQYNIHHHAACSACVQRVNSLWVLENYIKNSHAGGFEQSAFCIHRIFLNSIEMVTAY